MGNEHILCDRLFLIGLPLGCVWSCTILLPVFFFFFKCAVLSNHSDNGYCDTEARMSSRSRRCRCNLVFCGASAFCRKLALGLYFLKARSSWTHPPESGKPHGNYSLGLCKQFWRAAAGARETRSIEEELRLLQEGNRRAVIWIPGGLEQQVAHYSTAAPGIPPTLGRAVSPCSFQKF